MTCMTTPSYTKCEYQGAYYDQKLSSSKSRLLVISSVASLWHFVTERIFIYDVICYWSDLTWPESEKLVMFNCNRVIHAKVQLSIANGSGAIAKKNIWGPTLWPARAKGCNETVHLTLKMIWSELIHVKFGVDTPLKLCHPLVSHFWLFVVTDDATRSLWGHQFFFVMKCC